MDCEYSKRELKPDVLGWDRLVCKMDNQVCPYQYRCNLVNNWRSMNGLLNRCNIYKKEVDKQYMKNGQYKVLKEKRGLLYVELDSNTVIQVKNQLQIVPQSVDLIKIKDEYYIKGFDPKKSKSKIESEV